MAWESSTRRDRLPANWTKIRKRILIRDNYQCQARREDGRKCLAPANEVDHKRRGDNHADWNLEALCEWHHGRKSAREGAAAAAAKRKAISKRFRRTEAHPGEL